MCKCTKGFHKDPQTNELTRCMACNPILYSFDILFIPEADMEQDEKIFCLAECMAEHLTTVADVCDYQEKLRRF